MLQLGSLGLGLNCTGRMKNILTDMSVHGYRWAGSLGKLAPSLEGSRKTHQNTPCKPTTVTTTGGESSYCVVCVCLLCSMAFLRNAF